MRRSTSITSGRGQRISATSALHARVFCATYRPWSFGKSPTAHISTGGMGYLGKASLTPPSTVMVQPVVLAERSEARKSTASATSSGRMGAARILRLR